MTVETIAAGPERVPTTPNFEVWDSKILADAAKRSQLADFLALSFSTDEKRLKPSDMEEAIGLTDPDEPGFFVVGTLDGTIVSAAKANYIERWIGGMADVMQLTSLATHPEHRRQGLAKRVITELFNAINDRFPNKSLIVVADHEVGDAQKGLMQALRLGATDVFGVIDDNDERVDKTLKPRQLIVLHRPWGKVILQKNIGEDQATRIEKYELPAGTSVPTDDEVFEKAGDLLGKKPESQGPVTVLGGDGFSIDAVVEMVFPGIEKQVDNIGVRTAFVVQTQEK